MCSVWEFRHSSLSVQSRMPAEERIDGCHTRNTQHYCDFMVGAAFWLRSHWAKPALLGS
jgi:hypothetical protein